MRDLTIAAVLVGAAIGCSSDAEIGAASDDGGDSSDGSGGTRAETERGASALAGGGNAARSAANLELEGTGGSAASAEPDGTGASENAGGTGAGAGTGGVIASEDVGGTWTGGVGGGTGGTAGTSPSNYTVGDEGFVTTCGWSGFAWIAVDEASTSDPTDFDDLTGGMDLCMSGTVAASEDWTGVAMLGINIGQSDGEDENIPVATDGSGIYVDIANSAGSPLRIQIQDSSGSADANHRWCAVYTRPGVIRWSRK